MEEIEDPNKNWKRIQQRHIEASTNNDNSNVVHSLRKHQQHQYGDAVGLLPSSNTQHFAMRAADERVFLRRRKDGGTDSVKGTPESRRVSIFVLPMLQPTEELLPEDEEEDEPPNSVGGRGEGRRSRAVSIVSDPFGRSTSRASSRQGGAPKMRFIVKPLDKRDSFQFTMDKHEDALTVYTSYGGLTLNRLVDALLDLNPFNNEDNVSYLNDGKNKKTSWTKEERRAWFTEQSEEEQKEVISILNGLTREWLTTRAYTPHKDSVVNPEEFLALVTFIVDKVNHTKEAPIKNYFQRRRLTNARKSVVTIRSNSMFSETSGNKEEEENDTGKGVAEVFQTDAPKFFMTNNKRHTIVYEDSEYEYYYEEEESEEEEEGEEEEEEEEEEEDERKLSLDYKAFHSPTKNSNRLSPTSILRSPGAHSTTSNKSTASRMNNFPHSIDEEQSNPLKGRKSSVSAPPTLRAAYSPILPVTNDTVDQGRGGSLPLNGSAPPRRRSHSTPDLNPLIASLQDSQTQHSSAGTSRHNSPPLSNRTSGDHGLSALDAILNKFKQEQGQVGSTSGGGALSSYHPSQSPPPPFSASSSVNGLGTSVDRKVLRDSRDRSPQGPWHFRNALRADPGKISQDNLVKESLPPLDLARTKPYERSQKTKKNKKPSHGASSTTTEASNAAPFDSVSQRKYQGKTYPPRETAVVVKAAMQPAVGAPTSFTSHHTPARSAAAATTKSDDRAFLQQNRSYTSQVTPASLPRLAKDHSNGYSSARAVHDDDDDPRRASQRVTSVPKTKKKKKIAATNTTTTKVKKRTKSTVPLADDDGALKRRKRVTTGKKGNRNKSRPKNNKRKADRSLGGDNTSQSLAKEVLAMMENDEFDHLLMRHGY